MLSYDFSKRWKDKKNIKDEDRDILSARRTLGSVIKMLTPYDGYTDEFNAFLSSIPDHIKALVFLIKRISQTEKAGSNWRNYFTIDTVNGRKGHCLMFNNRKLINS